MKRLQWLYEVMVYFIALMFLYTAFSKLLDTRHFERAIKSQPFDDAFTPYLVILIPIAEIITGSLLVWPRFRYYGLLASTLLMFAFSFYVGLATFDFFPKRPCGCAGVFQLMTWPEHFIFNIFFLGLSIAGMRIHYSLKAPQG